MMINSQGSFVPGSSDPVRKGERVKVRVDVSPSSTSIPLAHDGADSNFVKSGVSEQIVMKADLPKILDMVETDTAAIARARATYENKLRVHLEERFKKKVDVLDRSTWDEDMHNAAYHFTASGMEAEFYEMNQRGIKPLRSVEVLEEVTPAVTPIEESNNALVEALAKALAKYIAPAVSKK